MPFEFNYFLFKVDVIVNSTGKDLRLHHGLASRALLERGGKRLQEECDKVAPNGIKYGEVAVTPGCQLQSPYVAHGACCAWKKGAETCKRVRITKNTYITLSLFYKMSGFQGQYKDNIISQLKSAKVHLQKVV